MYTVKVLLLVGYQCLWLSWVGQTTKKEIPTDVYTENLENKNSRIVSMIMCFFHNLGKLISTK